jgi:precorrin-6B methylase 2
MTLLLFFAFIVLLFLVGLLWIVIPAFYGLPSTPTKPDRIRKALKLANLQPGETIYDLGAGDGRVLLIAAGEFDAKAVGIEIGPLQCALAYLRAAASGYASRIRIEWGNYFKADLRQADVVFVYATSKEILQLASHLEKQMKPGSRVVSISADFPEWRPSIFDEQALIFIYSMPPKPGNLTTYLLEKTQ